MSRRRTSKQGSCWRILAILLGSCIATDDAIASSPHNQADGTNETNETNETNGSNETAVGLNCNENSCSAASGVSGSGAPSITLFSISSDSDLLPLKLMLPHQIRGSVTEGRQRLDKVLVLKMPPSPHHSAVVPGGEGVDEGAVEGVDEILQLDAGTLKDQEFFKRFLVDDRDGAAKSLIDLWQGGFQPSQNKSVEEPGVWHASTSALAVLAGLEQCNTTYCAFMEPDVFVHRHQGQPGWIDRAVKLMEAKKRLVMLQAPRLNQSEDIFTSCHTMQSRDGSLSLRYFIVHRERLEEFLPMRVDCAPVCDTLEAFFILPTRQVGLMSCGPAATWVVHAPESEWSLLRLFEGCAKADGRDEELRASAVRSDTSKGRRLSSVPLHAVPKEDEDNVAVVRQHRRLATCSWVGLPKFLEHISSDFIFSDVETLSLGEQMTDGLGGWTCPSAPDEFDYDPYPIS